MATISFYCVIEENDVEAGFPVDIKNDLTVGHLKKLIVEERQDVFKAINPAELKLWKAQSYGGIAKREDAKDSSPLSARTKLSKVLTNEEIENEQYYILVGKPDVQGLSTSALGASDDICDIIRQLQKKSIYRIRPNTPTNNNYFLEDMPFTEREESMDKAIGLIHYNVMKYLYKKNVAKADLSILVCSGTAGIGKTRYGVELARCLKDKINHMETENEIKLFHHYLNIILEFRGDFKLLPCERNYLSTTILGLRLAFIYFLKDKCEASFADFMHDVSNYHSLFTFTRVISAIRENLGINKSENLFLFFHIDEYQNIYQQNWQGESSGRWIGSLPNTCVDILKNPKYEYKEEGLNLFKDMMGCLGNFMKSEAKPNFVQVLLTGTAREEVVRHAEPTSFSFHFLKCPTLSIGACYDIMNHFANANNVQYKEWISEMAFFHLLSSTGGLPRAMQFLLEYIFEIGAFSRTITNIQANTDNIFISVANKLDSAYNITGIVRQHKLLFRELVQLCILEIPVSRDHTLCGNLTLAVLERDGHTVLEENEEYDENVLVRIPLYFLHLYNRVIREVTADLETAFLKNWNRLGESRYFERLIAEYEVYRTNLLIDFGCKTISLKDFYKGAVGKEEVLNLQVNLEKLKFKEVPYHFPKTGGWTVNGMLVPWTSDTVVLNGEHAPFADVCLWRHGAHNSNQNVICALQAKKWQARPLKFSELEAEHRKNKRGVDEIPLGEAILGRNDENCIKKARVITILITTADFEHFGEEEFTKSIPNDCLIICKENFREFFGRAFSLHATLSATQDCSWNFGSKRSLSSLKRNNNITDEDYEKIFDFRPHRSYDDLVTKIPSLRSKRLPENIGFLPFQDLPRKRRCPSAEPNSTSGEEGI